MGSILIRYYFFRKKNMGYNDIKTILKETINMIRNIVRLAFATLFICTGIDTIVKVVSNIKNRT